MTSRLFAAGAALMLLAGCFDEELPDQNLDGSVIIPAGLVDDPRELGPVYLGVYEALDPGQLGYPYPATGPRVGDAPIGDALPYGGTSIGDYTYGCYLAMRCLVVSGRYGTLDDVVEVNPLENEDGAPVTAEELFDQCTYYYGWNALSEFSFVGEDDLDFTRNDDGDWEAPFRAWHTRVPAGALLWAFADNDRTSCSVDVGAVNRKRPEDGQWFREGGHSQDILNYPDKYITAGDLISETPAVLEEGRTEGYKVTLDYPF